MKFRLIGTEQSHSQFRADHLGANSYVMVVMTSIKYDCTGFNKYHVIPQCHCSPHSHVMLTLMSPLLPF